jgi:flagella basal body P-ring formation protein FlgA
MAWSGNHAHSGLRRQPIRGSRAAKTFGRRATVTTLYTARMMRESRRWASGPRNNRLATTALVLFGAMLLTAVWAFADPSAATSAGANPPPSTDLEARIVERLAPLMPPGVRIRKVEIPCRLEAGAMLKSVAPGITRLTSRSFTVEFEVNRRTRFCSASLDAQKQVLVATRDLAADAPVSARDFAPGWVDAFSAAPGAPSAFDFTAPLATATFIRAGQPLYPTTLVKPVAVRPGDLVTVVVKNGPITVKTELESRATASIGDSATMLNQQTGTTVQVSVTGVRTGELVLR